MTGESPPTPRKRGTYVTASRSARERLLMAEYPFLGEDNTRTPLIPVWRTPAARVADVVQCPVNPQHLASREAFEDCDGCPDCLRTPGERQAALQARESLLKRRRAEKACFCGH